MGTWVISGRIKNPSRYKMEDNFMSPGPNFGFDTYNGYRGRSVPQNPLSPPIFQKLNFSFFLPKVNLLSHFVRTYNKFQNIKILYCGDLQ